MTRLASLCLLAALLAGCTSTLRTAYQPAALNGQSDRQLDADHTQCQAIGYRAGQGHQAGIANSTSLVGGGAGALAAGSTGGGVGAGAGFLVDSIMELRRRGLLMHGAYRDCMGDRGYRGGPEMKVLAGLPTRGQLTGRPAWCGDPAVTDEPYIWDGAAKTCTNMTTGRILTAPRDAIATDPGPPPPAPTDPHQALLDYADGKP